MTGTSVQTISQKFAIKQRETFPSSAAFSRFILRQFFPALSAESRGGILSRRVCSSQVVIPRDPSCTRAEKFDGGPDCELSQMHVRTRSTHGVDERTKRTEWGRVPTSARRAAGGTANCSCTCVTCAPPRRGREFPRRESVLALVLFASALFLREVTCRHFLLQLCFTMRRGSVSSWQSYGQRNCK